MYNFPKHAMAVGSVAEGSLGRYNISGCVVRPIGGTADRPVINRSNPGKDTSDPSSFSA